ncbi:cytochrome P450 [Cyathus striatus]|nr:cytochrome P450 [Cyathus striatus]
MSLLSPISLFKASAPYLSVGVTLTIIYFLSPPFLRRWVKDKDGNHLPAGPAIRYLFLHKYPELSLDTWAKQFGPLYSLWLGNQLFVIVSDPHVARELFITNGAIFSSRKNYYMKNQLILNGRGVTGSEYGDKWRQHRRLITKILSQKPMQDYSRAMDYESRAFIKSLFDDGLKGECAVDPTPYTGLFTLNNMLIMSFGERVDIMSDPLVSKVLDIAVEYMHLSGAFSNIIDFMEPLQWIPTYKRSRGRTLHDKMIEVYGSLIIRFKERMEADESVPNCFVKMLLETQEEERLDWEDLCMLSAVFILGGAHSTAGIIQWFLAVIPSHPEIVMKAHEELDRVIGRERWPNNEDEPNLPYIRAVIKEVQRTHSPFWTGIPHFSSEDFTYEGVFIPKDTVVVLNSYTLHHDEKRYPDAFSFKPERYLNDSLSCAASAKLSNVLERDHWTFGVGRRICPGLPAAEREMWLAISRLLWSFDFRALPDQPISLQEYEGYSGHSPLPFKVRLVPRHEGVDTVLGQAVG